MKKKLIYNISVITKLDDFCLFDEEKRYRVIQHLRAPADLLSFLSKNQSELMTEEIEREFNACILEASRSFDMEVTCCFPAGTGAKIEMFAKSAQVGHYSFLWRIRHGSSSVELGVEFEISGVDE
jgi:hypothetical protein